jgi:hypothetical protein
MLLLLLLMMMMIMTTLSLIQYKRDEQAGTGADTRVYFGLLG